MSDSPIRIAKFVVTRQHFAHIFAPASMPSGSERFSIRCPADVYPECDPRDRPEDELGPLVNVSSMLRPTFIPGDGTNAECRAWDELVAQAVRWGYSPNYLLIDREVQVAGTVWQSFGDRYRLGAAENNHHASLAAVRVSGDFSKDERLAAHILEVKGRFD